MQSDRRSTLKKPWQIYSLLGFAATAMLAAMLLLSRGGWQMSQQHVPLVDAIHEMRVQIALFHLWFEELAQGDESISPGEVWARLDQSEAYVNAMRRGGGVGGYRVVPLDDPLLLEKIGRAVEAIERLRTIGRQRLLEGGVSGSVLDQEFDAAFEQVSGLSMEVEAELQKAIAERIHEFKQLVYFLIVLIVAVTLGIALLIYRYEREREWAEDRIKALAFYDMLTGLPNRSLFYDRLNQAMAVSRRNGVHGALLFLDLDNFKPLNDIHGHDAGDRLLVEVAQRLERCVRKVDTVARFGGDEFVVVLAELDKDRDGSAQQACLVAKKICDALAEPYVLDGLKSQVAIDYRCTTSCGVALFSGMERGADELLKHADMAMYRAKERGRNQFVLWED